MHVPSNLDWELLVVDNGSTDNTSEVASSFASLLPIRCVREEEPGLSNARNRGVDEANGAYICWTDDDVVIEPQWLSAYVAAFRRHPEAAIFGGRIIPVLEEPTPDWFAACRDTPLLTNVLAQRDFGDGVISITIEEGRTPWGANFALRGVEQRRHRYDPCLGASRNRNRTGEESQVIRRIIAEGGTGWWVPDARVKHIIPTERQSIKYIYKYNFSRGESWAYLETVDPKNNFLGPHIQFRKTIGGIPIWLLRHAAIRGLRFACFRHFARPEVWLSDLCDYALYRGAISYWRQVGYRSVPAHSASAADSAEARGRRASSR
jgi:glucosyl-dolichyl phosphate glucuronosyltransferase